MKICGTCAIAALCLTWSLIFPIEAASQQASQPTPTVQVPPNLPPPVGEDKRVQGDDIDKVLADANVILLDVREPWELEKYGARPGYVNIPLGELEKRLSELPKDKTILTA